MTPILVLPAATVHSLRWPIKIFALRTFALRTARRGPGPSVVEHVAINDFSARASERRWLAAPSAMTNCRVLISPELSVREERINRAAKDERGGRARPIVRAQRITPAREVLHAGVVVSSPKSYRDLRKGC
jgi:hypothetical protein